MQAQEKGGHGVRRRRRQRAQRARCNTGNTPPINLRVLVHAGPSQSRCKRAPSPHPLRQAGSACHGALPAGASAGRPSGPGDRPQGQARGGGAAADWRAHQRGCPAGHHHRQRQRRRRRRRRSLLPPLVRRWFADAGRGALLCLQGGQHHAHRHALPLARTGCQVAPTESATLLAPPLAGGARFVPVPPDGAGPASGACLLDMGPTCTHQQRLPRCLPTNSLPSQQPAAHPSCRAADEAAAALEVGRKPLYALAPVTPPGAALAHQQAATAGAAGVFSAAAPLPPITSEAAGGDAAARRLAAAMAAALRARPASITVKLRCNLGRQFFAASRCGGNRGSPAGLGALALEDLQVGPGGGASSPPGVPRRGRPHAAAAAPLHCLQAVHHALPGSPALLRCRS